MNPGNGIETLAHQRQNRIHGTFKLMNPGNGIETKEVCDDLREFYEAFKLMNPGNGIET